MGMSQYLKSSPTKVKYPVGKVAGESAYTYTGSSAIHILVEKVIHDEDGNPVRTEWRLRCAPTKKAVYSYMGFRVAVTCTRCKMGKAGNVDAA